LEERAAKMGFAKYLPSDTEVMLSVYNAQQSAEQLKTMKLMELISRQVGAGAMGGVELEAEEMLEAEQGDEEDAEAAGMNPGEPNQWMLLGQEVTLAFGQPAGEQFGNLLTVNRRLTYFQGEAMGLSLQGFAENGDSSELMNPLSTGLEMELLTKLLQDPESGAELLNATAIPPMYLAFRAKEGELQQAAQLVNSGMAFFAMAGEMAVPVEIETGGSVFRGYKLLGSQIAKQLEAGREGMEKNLSPETVDAIIEVVARKNLVFATGTIGDYIVMMMGGDEEEFRLESDLKKSLVASEEVGFIDDYIDKQLISTSFGKKDLLETLVDEAGGIASYALGLREGISEGERLGETRDLEEMLIMVADREKALLAMGSSEDYGMVAFLEEGVKIESIGGSDEGAVDWDNETKLAHLGGKEGTLMFLNIPSNAAYDEKLGDYLEAMFETAYAMTMKFSEIEIEDPDSQVARMMGYAKMFDEKFREDVLGIYETMSGEMAEGLGHELAVVIDLNGSVPAVPDIPQAVILEAKAPRITLIKPVTEREKLAAAWKSLDAHATSLLPNLSELLGEKIPMQKPISAKTDDMVTWFIAFPFLQDDFLPSVTVSDNWFAASTSKTQAVDLMTAAEAGGESGEGVNFHVDFTALSDYADEMLKVIDKHAEEIFTGEGDLEGFREDKAEYLEFIEATREFDSLSWTIRKEDGSVKSRVHFKTK
jgi:hypothetical protein